MTTALHCTEHTQDASELLADYGRELDLQGALTLRDLIESHRRLRALSVQTNGERRAQLRQAADHAAALAREQVLHGEYVSLDRLRSMPLQEICDLCGPSA